MDVRFVFNQEIGEEKETIVRFYNFLDNSAAGVPYGYFFYRVAIICFVQMQLNLYNENTSTDKLPFLI